MATGCVSRHGKSWRYVIELPRDPDTGRRRQVSKGGFRTRKQAQEALNEARHQMRTGTFVRPSTTTLAAFLRDEWLPAIASTVRPGTADNYRRDLERHIIPPLGGLRLQAVTAGQLSAVYGRLLTNGRADGKGGLAPKTVRNIGATAHRALADAVKWGHLSRNPADQATLPRASRPQMTVWTPDQTRAFLAHVAGDRLYAAWLVLATTGMRRGELLGLRWTDIDLDAGRLSITQTLVVTNYQVRISEPKTRAGRRSLALDAATVAALRTHRTRQREERLAFGAGYTDTGLVFTREGGTAIHPQRLSCWFTQRVRAAGLPAIRLHDLRHSWASAALQSGVHPKVVSERLGHANIGITLDTYSHVLPSLDAAAADTVATAILGP